MLRSPVALHGRAWPVRRQVEDGRSPGELLPPVGKLLLQKLALQPLPLPVGKVRILDRQLRQRRGLPSRKRAVEGRQFPEKEFHRPAVRDDVMHGQQQHVFRLAQPQQGDVQKRPLG